MYLTQAITHRTDTLEDLYAYWTPERMAAAGAIPAEPSSPGGPIPMAAAMGGSYWTAERMAAARPLPAVPRYPGGPIPFTAAGMYADPGGSGYDIDATTGNYIDPGTGAVAGNVVTGLPQTPPSSATGISRLLAPLKSLSWIGLLGLGVVAYWVLGRK